MQNLSVNKNTFFYKFNIDNNLFFGYFLDINQLLKIIMMMKMKPGNGEKPVTVVRKNPRFSRVFVDLSDYSNPAISAIIPCWQSADGKLTSIATGEPITVGEYDQVRNCLVGTIFRYPNGEKILLTRNGRRDVYFITPEREYENFYNAFGE